MEAATHSHRHSKFAEPVPAPLSHPGREHLVGNRVRWAVQVLRHRLYRRRTRQTALF